MENQSGKSKNILIITYYWPPAGGPGVQRWVKFANYLPEFGFSPVVLTVKTEDASYAFKDDSLLKDVSDKIKVVRTKSTEFYNLYLKLTGKKNIPFSGFVHEGKIGFKERAIRFLRTHLFIPDPRKGWNRYAVKEACRLINEYSIRFIVTSGPPHSTHLAGLRLKRLFPYIFWIADFRDPWTHIFYFNQLNHSSVSRRIHRKMEKEVLTISDRIIVVSNSMREDFYKDHQEIEKDKIAVITNGYDEKEIPLLKPVPGKEFTITYTGTLAESYRILAWIDAVAEINRTSKEKIKVRFVGEIAGKYKEQLVSALGEEWVDFISPVSHYKAIDYMFRSHILLLVIPDAAHNEAIVTGKIFEYIATKIPILGIGPVHGDAAAILAGSNSGRMFDYGDRTGILDFIIGVLNKDPRWNFNSDPEKTAIYSRKNLTGKFAELLRLGGKN